MGGVNFTTCSKINNKFTKKNLQRKIYKEKLSPGSFFRGGSPALDLALDLGFDLAPEQQIERIENLQGASQSQTISKPSK